MTKLQSGKLSNPHILVITSLLLAYSLVFIPSFQVGYQTLPAESSDSFENTTQQVTDKHVAFLRVGEDIKGVDDEQCFFTRVKWPSKLVETIFSIIKAIGFPLVCLPIFIWFGIYLKAYPIPIPLYLLIVVVLFVGPVIILFIFGDKSGPKICDPPPVFLINYIIPFWFAVLVWLGSMGTAISVYRQIRVNTPDDSSTPG